MNVQTFVILIVILLAGLNIYSQYAWRGKLLCLFRRPNRTVIEKKISVSSKYVVFDGGIYHVNTKYIDLMWFTRGIHQLFPMFVPFLEYRWNTEQPLDPTTFKDTWLTPEARMALNQEDNIKALNRAAAAQSGKKESSFQRLLPWITIGIIVIIAYLVYQMNNDMGLMQQHMFDVQDQIKAFMQVK